MSKQQAWLAAAAALIFTAFSFESPTRRWLRRSRELLPPGLFWPVSARVTRARVASAGYKYNHTKA
jgi:hypothetical protein